MTSRAPGTCPRCNAHGDDVERTDDYGDSVTIVTSHCCYLCECRWDEEWRVTSVTVTTPEPAPETPKDAPEPFPLCQPCQDNIGGACAGPDAPWRPTVDGEACGAVDCCTRLDLDTMLEMMEINGFDKASLLRDLKKSESDLRADLLTFTRVLGPEAECAIRELNRLDTSGLESAIKRMAPAQLTHAPNDRPPVGARVRLTEDAERFPHFIADKGAVGTVTMDDDHLYAVKMDEHLDGCEEWDNEVCWIPEDDDHATREGQPCMGFTRPPVEVLP